MRKEKIGLILIGLVGLVLLFSAAMKVFAAPPEAVEQLGGAALYRPWLTDGVSGAPAA